MVFWGVIIEKRLDGLGEKLNEYGGFKNEKALFHRGTEAMKLLAAQDQQE